MHALVTGAGGGRGHHLVCDLVSKSHDLSKPQGVRGRNSDNSTLRSVLHWEPATTLADGLRPTYQWIEEQLRCAGHLEAANQPEAKAE